MRKKQLAVAALLALIATGCGDHAERALTSPDGATPRLSVASVGVCCVQTVYQGVQYQVYADVRDQTNNPISNPPVSWSTSANGVASISGAGSTALVQAVGVGQTTIYANVNGVLGSTTLTVLAAPVVTTVQVAPSSVTVNTAATQTLTATAYSQYGNPMSGQTVTWVTGNSSVATVSSSGVVTGVAPGTTTVTATIAGKSASVNITVQNAITTGGIYGPALILNEGTYSWGLSSVSGGNGTYSYQWEIDWFDTPFEGFIPVAGGDSFSRQVTGCEGGFEIRAHIFSGGASTWVNYTVENYASASMCL